GDGLILIEVVGRPIRGRDGRREVCRRRLCGGEVGASQDDKSHGPGSKGPRHCANLRYLTEGSFDRSTAATSIRTGSMLDMSWPTAWMMNLSRITAVASPSCDRPFQASRPGWPLTCTARLYPSSDRSENPAVRNI